MPEPKVTEIGATVFVGGKVQLVKFEQGADYGFSMTRKYAGEWTEEEASAFQDKLVRTLREEVEPHADKEYQELLSAREALNS
jgi:hypothetical protein